MNRKYLINSAYLINMSFNRSKEYSINEFKGGISKAKSKKEEITKSYIENKHM